ncbi:tetraacyldisaccharide 4'-kinase [Paraneptunicella aestuarii]|uniref:tetraacyldisaccharide 4'-kinase n=1 Tax=Paraneptunicella aestuarii TaxID=2831148 RepID=UPI001E614219|nr:tetraacyldisaccharide 4'-kinase [Paraneptunicella aestuarii]UAA40522.1 tetraacyldisaccharide 4'-kinase [Paraneptunicella aestuarii]
MSALEQAWYKSSWWVWLLWPFTLLFGALSAIRRYLFKRGIFSSTAISAPVIVVGNISVGGNGKTPLVIALCRWLSEQGVKPGVVSRGYGGKLSTSQFPFELNRPANPSLVGDEPAFISERLSCPIVIDPIRARGAAYLVEQCQCDVVICDDGLQHYALQRDIEIAVVDGVRRHGNGFLLPMGPLREGLWRLETVDFVVVNGGETSGNEVPMALVPGELTNLCEPKQTMPLSQIKSGVIAAAGIGNPQRFFDLLQQHQIQVEVPMAFPDHYQYQEGDLPAGKTPVLMTEKDAVKCAEFAQPNWWYLPVEAQLPSSFLQKLKEKLQHSNTGSC